MSDPVAEAFVRFRAQYFAGRLTRWRARGVASLPQGAIGRCVRARRMVAIVVPTDELEATLLHEMAHAATNDRHGPRWQAEMRRLRDAAAPISPDEPDCYDDQPPVDRAWMQDRATQAVRRGAGFSAFARAAAYELAMPVGAFRRRYWWARSVFDRVRADRG